MKYSDRITALPGLSSSALIPFFTNHVQKDSPTILNGQPFSACGPPIVIFHPVFDQFLKKYGDPDASVLAKDIEWTEKLMRTATEGYSTEEKWQKACGDLFADYWGHSIGVTTLDGARLDSVLLSKSNTVPGKSNGGQFFGCNELKLKDKNEQKNSNKNQTPWL